MAKVKEYQPEIFHGPCPACAERERRAALQQNMTFREVAALYLTAHQDASRNATHRKHWEITLRDSAFPALGDMPARIDTGAVMAAPQQHSHTRTATAKKLQGRIERVIEFAKGRGWRRGEKPARWRRRNNRAGSRIARQT
jgi:hypothetical protein